MDSEQSKKYCEMVIYKYVVYAQITICTLFASSNSSNTLFITDSSFSAEITRDDWGVPHVYGKRDADASFGLAYAHSEDDFQTIQDVIYSMLFLFVFSILIAVSLPIFSLTNTLYPCKIMYTLHLF